MTATESIVHSQPRRAPAPAISAAETFPAPWPQTRYNPPSQGRHASRGAIVHAALLRRCELPVTPAGILVIAVLGGSALRVSDEDASLELHPGSAVVLASHGTVQLAPHGHARVLVAQIERERFQAFAAAYHEEPCKLRSAATKFEFQTGAFDLSGFHPAQALDCLSSLTEDVEEALCETVLDALDRTGAAGAVWSTVVPLKRATDFILGNPEGDLRPEAIAGRVGMTLVTLQRQAKEYLGSSLAAFVRDVRLTRAHQRLLSARESRTIDRIARELGFQDGRGFTRAYQRRFGETPTATRVRGVQEAG